MITLQHIDDVPRGMVMRQDFAMWRLGFNTVKIRELFIGVLLMGGCLVAFDAPYLASTISINRVDYGVGVNAVQQSTPLSDINGTLNQDSLRIMSVSFTNSSALRSGETAIELLEENKKQVESAIEAKVIGKALMVPNPARQIDEPRLYYVLSKNMNIEFRLYDMMARLLFSTTFASGSDGGREGVNWLKIGPNSFEGFAMPAGVYFFLLMHEGKVLAKGKVAMIP